MKSGLKNGANEPTDWDDWLEAHSPALLLFARQQSRCEADAQDLLQEALVESWRAQTNGTLPPVSTVYWRIRKRAIDLGRRDDRRASRESAFLPEEAPAWFDSTPEERERNRLLEETMKGLPEMHREIITLKIWGELTFEEIAGVLEIPANTAASRYRYALGELRKRTREILA